MKSLILILLLACPAMSRAQEVFDAVLVSAQNVMNDPDADDTGLALAQFKLTQLQYLNRKAVDAKMTYYQMDIQAYYLSEFLSAYLRMLTMMALAPRKEQKDEILKFSKASEANPLFGDKDTATTLAFVNDPMSLTPFSLDTDWEKAYRQMFPKRQ